MASQNWSEMFDFLPRESKDVHDGIFADEIVGISAVQIVVVNVSSTPKKGN